MGCGCSSLPKVAPEDALKRAWSSLVPGSVSDNDEEDEVRRFRDLYVLGEKLGSGSSGEVRRVMLKTHRRHAKAVKIIKRGCGDPGAEIAFLVELCHPNIVKLYDTYEGPDVVYIIMGLCSGGNLRERLLEDKSFSEEETLCMGRQMLRAMEHIHYMKVVHRDVKAENFMLVWEPITSQVKLIDFGLASRIQDQQFLTENCGSAYYLAPEVLTLGKYRYEVDIWALGVLFYLLLYGHFPHNGINKCEIYKQKLKGEIRWQTTVELSAVCLDFLERLLEYSPCRRSSARQALDHPWISMREPPKLTGPEWL
eukprot:TRINITY_DN19194_c0_g1_i1.p1 TRINITY_DN19194_c0_g1~~TRINITY_DN19194_c0_g1_i1.p1  ORF type:complete len:310 (-),score=51.99 TRINITY_DN19194_c0_g1_i1:288-1217(-)